MHIEGQCFLGSTPSSIELVFARRVCADSCEVIVAGLIALCFSAAVSKGTMGCRGLFNVMSGLPRGESPPLVTCSQKSDSTVSHVTHESCCVACRVGRKSWSRLRSRLRGRTLEHLRQCDQGERGAVAAAMFFCSNWTM